MSSNSKDREHMTSNDFGDADFFQNMSKDVKRTFSGHVLFPQMCPQTFKRTGQAIAN